MLKIATLMKTLREKNRDSHLLFPHLHAFFLYQFDPYLRLNRFNAVWTRLIVDQVISKKKNKAKPHQKKYSNWFLLGSIDWKKKNILVNWFHSSSSPMTVPRFMIPRLWIFLHQAWKKFFFVDMILPSSRQTGRRHLSTWSARIIYKCMCNSFPEIPQVYLWAAFL